MRKILYKSLIFIAAFLLLSNLSNADDNVKFDRDKCMDCGEELYQNAKKACNTIPGMARAAGYSPDVPNGFCIFATGDIFYMDSHLRVLVKPNPFRAFILEGLTATKGTCIYLRSGGSKIDHSVSQSQCN